MLVCCGKSAWELLFRRLRRLSKYKQLIFRASTLQRVLNEVVSNLKTRSRYFRTVVLCVALCASSFPCCRAVHGCAHPRFIQRPRAPRLSEWRRSECARSPTSNLTGYASDSFASLVASQQTSAVIMNVAYTMRAAPTRPRRRSSYTMFRFGHKRVTPAGAARTTSRTSVSAAPRLAGSAALGSSMRAWR